MNKIRLFLVVTVAIVSFAQGAEEKNEKPAEKKHTVIDVRTASEYQEDHFDGAINIPYDKIKERIGNHVKDKGRKIIVYCRSGGRSHVAAVTLTGMGYTNVVDAGALEELWRKTIRGELE